MKFQAIPNNSSLVRQSSEITDSFPQYIGKAGEYWEKFLELLRNRYDTITDQYKTSDKKKSWIEILSEVKSVVFDIREVDSKHVQRVVNEAYYILRTPKVIYGDETLSGIKTDKKGRFRAINTLEDVDYDKKHTLKLVFTDAILSHYLGDKLTVEYDVKVKNLLKTNFGPILYQRCCKLENGVNGYFEMTEDDIRLALGIDTVADYEKMNTHIIRDKKDLEITKGIEYDRFDDLYKKVRKACDEINELEKKGICPFYVDSEVISETPYPRRRGAPSKEYKVNFKIRRYVYDTEYTANQIEEADAIEISPESITPPPVSGTQVEIGLNFSDESDLTKSLVQIRDKITSIFKASKATHTKVYVPGIIKQIKERYSACPELPSIVLAWISYCEKEVVSKNGEISEISKLLQSKLKHHCQLYYKGVTYTGERIPEYPPGFEPTVICANPSEGDNQTNQYTIINSTNYGRVKANSAEVRRAKLDRDAEEAGRRVMARPYIPKVH